MKQDTAKSYSVLLWPALILILLASLLAILHWIFKQDLEGFNLDAIEPGYLVVAILFQVVALAFVVLAWHSNLRNHNVEGITLLQSAMMIGICGLGKYTPGKVWGLVARGLVLYRIVPQQDKVVIPTLIEQFALVHGGLVLGGLAYFMDQGEVAGVLVVGLLLPLSVHWISRAGAVILRLVNRIGKKHLKTELVEVESFRTGYTAVFWFLLFMWFFASIVLFYCAKAIAPLNDLSFPLILLGTVLAYLGGFVAFFSLAGLGVREGIMIGILAPFLGLEAALYTSVLHRLITIALDILLAVLSIILLKSNITRDDPRTTL